MIRLKQPIILEGEYTLGEMNVYAQKGYDFSLRSDSDLKDFFLKLVKIPEDVSLEELQEALKDLGVYEASVVLDERSLQLSRVTWAADWSVSG